MFANTLAQADEVDVANTLAQPDEVDVAAMPVPDSEVNSYHTSDTDGASQWSEVGIGVNAFSSFAGYEEVIHIPKPSGRTWGRILLFGPHWVRSVPEFGRKV